jgi:hypothetical protein
VTIESETSNLNLELLFKLRLVVGRFGEMDNAGWWNTKEVLGPTGRIVYQRGFPRTHSFTRARVVFTVARERTQQLLKRPNALTLWRLTPSIDDQFESRWHDWLKEPARWQPFFEKVEALEGEDLSAILGALELTSAPILDAASQLRPKNGAAQLSDTTLTPTTIQSLAAAYCLGKPGRPVVPFIEHAD